MRYRSFTGIILLSVLFLLGVAGCIVYIVDPYMQYHVPHGELAYEMETNSFSYYNPGIAKNYDYDTVITGSSMSRSFLPSYVDEKMGYNTVKLSMAEARGKDFGDLFTVLERQDNWKRVIMGLDTFAFKVDKNFSSYEKPMYLYDEKIYNDVYYVFNMDGLLESADVVLDTKVGKKTTSMDDYQNYVLSNTFSKEQVLNYFEGVVERTEEYDLEMLEKTILDNLNQNLIPVIERNQDREFLFYFPPYSIVRWAKTPNVAEDIKAMEIIIDRLIEYPNVALYFYQGETEVITDLNHYMDTIHFDSEVANGIVDYMSDENNKLTTYNYKDKLESFKEYINDYEYGKLKEAKEVGE